MSADPFICLCSGGLDSTVALAAMVARKVRCIALFVDYGQAARQAEARAVRRVSDHYGVELKSRHLALWADTHASMLLGGTGGPFLLHRNLALLLCADVVAAEARAAAIVTGLCVAPAYPDSSRAFVALASNTLSVSAASGRRVLAPLIEFDKPAIGQLAAELGVPVSLTVSCYRDADRPCGDCRGCADRASALEAFDESCPR